MIATPRLLIIVAALALLLPARPAAAGPATTPVLSVSRSHTVIDRDMVHLGDLFTNTGTRSDTPVGRAPAPGSEAVYDVHRLAAIARANDLVWRARSWSERVVVERAARTIGAAEIKAAITAALHHGGLDGDWQVDLPKDDVSLAVPRHSTAPVSVESLDRDAASGRFMAVVTTRPGDAAAPHLTVAGRLRRMIEVPVPTRRLPPGDIIGKADIAWTTAPADRVGRNVVTDPDRLIGMTPDRTLMPGRPVTAGSVRPPRLVAKGSLVTMLLTMPHMVLTSKGRALQDGAKGDVIRVRNTQGNTIIQGEVTAAGAIRVTAAGPLPTLAAAGR